MDNFKSKDLYELLAFLSGIGICIMSASNRGEDPSPALYYLGVGVTLAGSAIKIFTKRGAMILAAGVLGNMFLKSDTPICISAGVLACWYLLDYHYYWMSHK